MKTAFALLPLLAGVALPALANQETARVISSTPIVEQVAIPQQVCSQQPVVTSAPKSGAGAVIGGIAGGAVGNAIGHGSGRAAATMLGIFGGAVLGDHVEGSSQQVQNVQTCSTQTMYEERTTGYNVVYEYAGRQYSMRTPNDPGQYVRINVTPADSQAMSAPPVTSTYSTNAPVYSSGSAPVSVQPGVVVSTTPAPVVYPATVYRTAPVYAPVYAAPVYAAPYYAAPAYYPPVGVSLNFGYSNWHGGGRWR